MNVRLFALGLLQQEPMHGYQLRQLLEQGQTWRWAEVLPGSIYHALKALEREGKLEVVERGGRNRSVYALTPAGQEELLRLAELAWDGGPGPLPTRLYAALRFAHLLPPSLRAQKITAALARVNDEILQWQAGFQAKMPYLDDAGRLLFENALAHLELDRALLRRLLDAPEPTAQQG